MKIFCLSVIFFLTAALNQKEHPFLSINNIQPTIFPKNKSSNFSLTSASSSKTELDDTGQLSGTFSTPQTLSIPVGKQVGSHYRMDSCDETQVRNGKVQGDGRGRNQLLPRYRPQITEEELRQISSWYPIAYEGSCYSFVSEE